MLTVSLSTGDWTMNWNGENRLKQIAKSDQKLDFVYDYKGRRVEKKVTDKVGTIWTQSKHLKFVYETYKLIEVLDGANSDAVLQKIVWSGETPISIYDASLDATYYYVLDANKNVSDLIDASGNVVAHYEYSPFGKIVRQTGTYADTNPIRFSSEYFDSETGLVYYNFRYYCPELGRWTKRDPIEEGGGWNLYVILRNDSTNFIDYLGYGNGQITQTSVGGVIPVGNRVELVNNGNGFVPAAIPSTPSGDRTTRNLNGNDFPGLYDPHEVGPNLTPKEVIQMYKNGTIWTIHFTFTQDGGPIMGRKEDFNPVKKVKCKRDGQYITEYKEIKRYFGEWDKELPEKGEKISISGNTPPPWRDSNPSRTPQTVRKKTESKRYSRTRTRYAKYSRKLVQCKCRNEGWVRKFVMDLGFRDFEINSQTENYYWQYTGTKTREDNESPLFQ